MVTEVDKASNFGSKWIFWRFGALAETIGPEETGVEIHQPEETGVEPSDPEETRVETSELEEPGVETSTPTKMQAESVYNDVSLNFSPIHWQPSSPPMDYSWMNDADLSAFQISSNQLNQGESQEHISASQPISNHVSPEYQVSQENSVSSQQTVSPELSPLYSAPPRHDLTLSPALKSQSVSQERRSGLILFSTLQ